MRKGVWRRARGTNDSRTGQLQSEHIMKVKILLAFLPSKVNAEIVIISVVSVQIINEDPVWFEPK